MAIAETRARTRRHNPRLTRGDPAGTRISARLGGPVSKQFEADVSKQALGRAILVWPDGGGHYTGFVDRLRAARAAGALPYEVYGLRGSYLALLLELEAVAVGAEPAPVVVHLPGHNEESVRATPQFLGSEVCRRILQVTTSSAVACLERPGRRASRGMRAGRPRSGRLRRKQDDSTKRGGRA